MENALSDAFADIRSGAVSYTHLVGLTRQKVNYYLHGLEAHGLVRLAGERKWGGLTERLLVATAASYVVSPSALGPVAADPNREIDRLSASYLLSLIHISAAGHCASLPFVFCSPAGRGRKPRFRSLPKPSSS